MSLAFFAEFSYKKICNTLLCYIKKQRIHYILHSKNALEMISEDPNIQKISVGACLQTVVSRSHIASVTVWLCETTQTAPMLIIREYKIM